jgi:hypothetical protein
VKGTFVGAFERNQYTARRLVVIAPATNVEVREVPSPRPATYCGGIGEYRVAVSASPTKLRVGDPLTLTLELQRGEQSDSLELVSAPDLAAIPELIADFDLIDNNPTGNVDGATKHFSYGLRPKRPSVEIPAITVTTFDPTSEQFIETTTKAIPLEVSEASRLTAGELVGSLPSTGSAENKTLTQGIFQNITNPAEVYDQRVNIVGWSIAGTCAWLLAGGLMAAMTIYRRKSSDAAWRRRQQARRVAQKELGTARQKLVMGNPNESLLHVRAALLGFVADTQNLVTSGLTTSEIASALSAVSVPPEDRDAAVRLLESIESTAYGGGQTADAAGAIETAERLITKIAPRLERGASA